MLAVWRRVWDDGGMKSISTIALCAACAALSCCQVAPVTTFYKEIDARNKSIALPRRDDGDPANLELFRTCLRNSGWRIIVAGISEGNGNARYENSGAKYTLIGKGSTDGSAAAAFAFGLIGYLATKGGRINFTLIESATGEEVMHISGSEGKWKPCDTVQEMNAHAR